MSSQLAPGFCLLAQGARFGGDLDYRIRSKRDAESLYVFAKTLVFAGAMEEGYELLLRAIERNYCAATGLENERIWDPRREDADFLEVLRLARECRDRFSLPTG